MQILALYVNVCMRESTSEEGILSVAPDAVKTLFPPQLFEECKGVVLFFFVFLSREPDPTGSGNLDLWVPPSPLCSLPPTEHLYLQAFSEQVCPPARHHC